MQLTNIATFVALIVGVAAVPGAHPPPPPPPPKPSPPSVITQSNTCSSGSPYCCSPSNGGSGTTCALSTTQCNSITICCNNAGFENGAASQNCGGTNSLQQPVVFI